MAGTDKRKQSLYFPEDMLREIQEEANRQDRSLSWIVQQAWKIARNEIIVRSRVIGGLQMIDAGEADDKLIGVLDNDYVWGRARNVSAVPSVLVERLQHYFLTYKLVPGQRVQARIARVYGRAHALKVVRAAMADYGDNFAL